MPLSGWPSHLDPCHCHVAQHVLRSQRRPSSSVFATWLPWEACCKDRHADLASEKAEKGKHRSPHHGTCLMAVLTMPPAAEDPACSAPSIARCWLPTVGCRRILYAVLALSGFWSQKTTPAEQHWPGKMLDRGHYFGKSCKLSERNEVITQPTEADDTVQGDPGEDSRQEVLQTQTKPNHCPVVQPLCRRSRSGLFD